MNKKLSQGVVVGALALFLTLMIGYALFSQNLTITGTAKAEGEFKIEATCYETLPTWTEEHLTLNQYTQKGNKNNSCTVEGKNIVMSTELEYPGANKAFLVKFSNVGSIDAKIANFLKGRGSGEIKSETKYCEDGLNGGTKDDVIDDATECDSDADKYDKILNYTEEAAKFKVGDSEYTIDQINNDETVAAEAMAKIMTEDGENIILRSGDDMYLYIVFKYDSSTTNQSLKKLEVKLNYPFYQLNS